MVDNHELNGLGGWLILIGIGVIISPFRLLVEYIPLYKPIFTEGIWSAITTVGSEAYIPYVGIFLLAEILFNTAMVIVSFYIIYLFFTKHEYFPKLYIAILIISIIFIPLDAWVGNFIFPDEPMFDAEGTKEMIRALGAGVVWIPYMLKSTRVRVTFVDRAPNKEI